jgi:cephalosporin-C deacetylase-like acetyl esterase
MHSLIALDVLLAVAICQADPVADPTTAAGRHACAIEQLKRTAAELSSACLAEPLTKEQWLRERPEQLRRLRSMLGLEPLPERTPLQAAITGTLERADYRVEKLVFQSLPGLYVTGNLYLPRERPGPLPAIVYACGHAPHPHGAKVDYQDRVVWFAENGYVVLILDTLEFGEVPGIHHGIHDLNMWHWVSLGYTPMGVEVWNAMRAIDYLESRPEVDRARIGMTGISGGGSATWYTAAVDERVAAAVPVCSTITFGTQAKYWRAAGQCDCIYFHNTYLTDFPIVAALIAPRPLLICSGQRDGDFMPDGYREVFERGERVYKLYSSGSKPARIVQVDDAVGHTDAPLFRQAARQWMNRWLRNDTHPVPLPARVEERPERPEDLACLERLPRDAVNYRIHDTFIPVAQLQPPASLDQWRQRREHVASQLRARVVRWFPSQAVPFETRPGTSDGGWAGRYARYRDVLFESESGVWIRAQLLQPHDRAEEDKVPLLVYAKRPGDSIYFMDLDELLPVLGRYHVLIVNPRWTEHSVNAAEYAEIERTATWCGRSVASMQLWDILRAVTWALDDAQLDPASVTVYGKSEMGVLAMYAAVLDDRINRVLVSDPPATHWRGPALLNVLRITDVPEVAGLLAPRELVFLRTVPDGFGLTRSIYSLQNAGDQLIEAGSLAEALQVWER